MLKTILLGALALLAVGIVVVLILAAMTPDSFGLQRSIAIKAPPEKIYPLIADLQAWRAWSPWENKDPDQKRSFSGPQSGVGARYGWDGNKAVGQGSMEIVEAVAPSKVGLKLDFVRPMEGHNTVVFALQPQGDMTNVLWTMTGPTPFFAKIIHVFINMDKMIGGDFEVGLAALKTQAER